MKNVISLLLVMVVLFACNSEDKKDSSEKKEKPSKEKIEKENNDTEETSDTNDAEDGDWTTAQKKKGSKRYIQLIETENNSIYDKNSEASVKNLADCMIDKIADRISFSDYTTIMDHFAEDKKVSELTPALKRKAMSINPFFKKCRDDAGVEY